MLIITFTIFVHLNKGKVLQFQLLLYLYTYVDFGLLNLSIWKLIILVECGNGLILKNVRLGGLECIMGKEEVSRVHICRIGLLYIEGGMRKVFAFIVFCVCYIGIFKYLSTQYLLLLSFLYVYSFMIYRNISKTVLIDAENRTNWTRINWFK